MSSMLFVLTLPLWAQALVTVGGTLSLSLVVRWVVNWLPSGQTLGRTREAANILRQPTTTIVALTLALSGIQVIGEFHRAEAEAAREASVLERLYRDARAYNGVGAAEFGDTLVTYVRGVVEDEWPAMRKMEEHPQTKQLFGQLFTISHQMHPADSREQMWLNDMVSQLNVAADLRRARISSAQACMPWIFYVVVISGSFIIICFSSLLSAGPGSEIVIGSHAAVIGLAILLVVCLDLPFSGTLGIKPDAFRVVLENVRLLTPA